MSVLACECCFLQHTVTACKGGHFVRPLLVREYHSIFHACKIRKLQLINSEQESAMLHTPLRLGCAPVCFTSDKGTAPFLFPSSTGGRAMWYISFLPTGQEGPRKAELQTQGGKEPALSMVSDSSWHGNPAKWPKRHIVLKTTQRPKLQVSLFSI